ncbi:hypothetical protein [Mesoplasma melaleucae]|uniref:Uncharacterized protein n=1 Tax=Mesoplasma melaleucae TaxID=81459 RepID=A0A2K8NYA8_9MOLU|nr:hypothetical protein [Mesoplasma melaleucae]ATZ18168.1 hypothetical protein EMELA_v1c06610 [Mesoplasma melaleucae]
MLKNKIILPTIAAFLIVSSLPVYSAYSLIENSFKKEGKFSGNQLENLLNFNDIPLSPLFRKSWEKLLSDSSSFSAAYDWQYKLKMERLVKSILKKDTNALNANFDKKPIRNKTSLTDAIYLGLQVMGHNKPTASELHEIGRYEIANFTALENAGYTIYVSNSDPRLEILYTDKSDLYNDGQKDYVKLSNKEGTDNIFFRTTELITSENVSNQSNSDIPVYFKAKKGDEILDIYDPGYLRNKLEIQIRAYDSDEMLQYKVWDWNQYNSNDLDLNCYIANNLIKIYCEIALSYIDFIDSKSPNYQQKGSPLTGANDPFKYSGATPGSLLYYAYKYNSYYDLRIFMFTVENNNQRIVYVSYDQNNELEYNKSTDEPIIDKHLKETNNNKENRERLSFNPWIDLNKTMRGFVEKTWNLLMFTMEEMS